MLDDFPQDEDLAFPISPANSVLDNLGALPIGRPSPSPTASKLEFTWSSGDIPLILYDDAYIDERVPGLFISGNNKRESVVTVVDDANHHFSQHSQRNSTSSRASLVDRHRESVVMSSLASSDTIRSAATFGTRKQPGSFTTETFTRQSAGEQPSQISESTITEDCGTVEAVLHCDACFSHDKVLHSVSNHSCSLGTSPGDDKQHFNIGERSSVSSIERARTPSGESTYVGPPSTANRASSLLESGGIKRSPSVQTWFSASEWDYKDHTPLDPTSGPFERTSLAFDELHSELVPPPGGLEVMPSHTPEEHQPFESDSAVIYGFDALLRATSVQFLIDQEGFRDAEPSFKFSGISRDRSSGENRPQDEMMAQFRPVSRQQFHFHHAPFESPPVLRRITVNNDDTSDYVSRQAHLTLKSNSVYVIHGHEVLSTEHPSEQTKLYWQFEYLVDDRRVESSSGSRRHMGGEKTFTPLTFSCSPRLLLPTQAKRINIMHVFKKSLAPKLVAEKLQVRLGTLRTASNPSPEKSFSPKALDYRVSRSHDRRSRGAGDDAASKRAVGSHVPLTGPHFDREIGYGTDDGGRTTPFAPGSLSRFSTHTPSSSVPVAKEDDDQNSSKSPIDVSHPVLMHGSSAFDRHIFPPARLSELLIQQDSSSEVGYAPSRVPFGGRSSFLDISERDSKTFVGLSPRPKRPL